MSGVYSVEDLLKLRASPLIRKPPNLPPIEEWMGSQEPTTKRPTTRGRQEDSHLQTEGFQKRSTLDPSARKSTTDPERIVLGPPRRSFASSNARSFGKLGTTDTDDTQKEGIPRHERTKTGEDIENKITDRRGGQFGGVNGRYGSRQDQDQERPRRRTDDEDIDGRPRRDPDRLKWSRDEKGREEVDENGNVKLSVKRESQTRSRFEQSWLRSDRGTEEARKETERSGWRRDRGKDGDWDMPGKGDADPEWMDTPEVAESIQVHTQEDFQRWKERMKAAANGPVDEKVDPMTATNATGDNTSRQQQTATTTGSGSTELNSNSMDKFFAKFTEKRTSSEEKITTVKPATKSKFASLFSPPPETKPDMPTLPNNTAMSPSPVPAPVPVAAVKIPTPVVDQANATMEADQAGFKRILEMLGKRDATPVIDAAKARPAAEQQPQERHQSPDLMALFKQSQPPRQTTVSQAPPGLERLIESRSPAEGHRRQQTPNKDELLLNLLRQADISAKSPRQGQHEYGEQRLPPGLFGGPGESGRNDPRHTSDDHQDLERQGQLQQRGNGRSIFDDPAVSGYSYQDELGNRQGIQRRPTNGFDDPYFDRLRQQEQKSMQPPPGMPRPPGLDQMSRMPPGWPNQPPPPQHQQPRQAPPPGINMPRGGMPPPFGAPPQGQIPPMPPQGQRPPQRKYTGESAMPNFPPGIGPPPGFMNNGPPPGFHQHNVSGQGQNYGRYAPEGQGLHQQGPPQMNRAFMEMYGNAERSGLRGGNGGVPLPPGFR